jgi:proteasome assembly chaperone (PAC2) family protein
MPDALELWEQPKAEQIYMIAGWRQWADAGSVSSGLPEYLVQQMSARPIGRIRPDGFYLFQIPGTHDLVRPMVKFEEGYPKSLEISRNELFYTGDEQRGVVILLGDEPHLDIERYTAAVLKAARTLGVKRIVGLGGVYGELPYNKERIISANYSLPRLKDEISQLAVNFSDYEGGASIGSYICRRAGDQDMEYIGLYAFVPAYSFAEPTQIGSGIRIDTDFMAWLGVMRRVNYMFKLGLNLSDLEGRSEQVVKVMDTKIAELERSAPQLGVREYLAQLSEGFNEVTFAPLADVWEEEMRRLLDEDEEGEGGN